MSLHESGGFFYILAEDKKQMIKRYFSALLFITILGGMIIIAVRNQNAIDTDIEQNRMEGVAMVTEFKGNRSFRRYYFSFYYNGIRQGSANLNGFGEEGCIGRYYKVEFSSDNPNHARIYLDHEVTDPKKNY